MNLSTLNKTKAAILVASHKPLVVSDVDLPASLRWGQVLVKIHYSTICGAQIGEIDAVKGPDKFLPHLLGHEASASVLEIGEGVKTVRVGDLVVCHWRPSNGREADPAVYEWSGKPLHAGWVTTFQEYAVVSENRLTAIAKNFDRKIAPLFGCAVTTAMGVVNNDAKVKIGQSVVVYGVGGVGLNIVQAASMVSAYPIIAVDIIAKKLAVAKRFGATHLVNGRKDIPDHIRSIVGERGADVVIDTTGNGRVIERCYELTHPDGKTILVGVTKKEDKVSIYTLPIHFKQILKGSHGGDSEPHIDIPRYIRLMDAGKMALDGIITHSFSLSKINDAIALVRKGTAGRVELVME